ncbi:MAG: YhdH/YhfP family quinone oxidoreductase [Candidatus Cyclobacteriaceae bacterium M3_2C_046]
MKNTFRAYQVQELGDGKFGAGVVERKLEQLPPNPVLIRVQYSSLNYKDALSASGHKGVTRNYPHTPGIDAAGVIVESPDQRFPEATEVLVTGFDLGMNTSGGFGQYIRVPVEWIIKKPEGLSLKESMAIGTAGLTAAIGIDKMLQNHQDPENGPVLVTGASGGVGSWAISLLSHLGYRVIASSGKLDAYEYLKNLGAEQVVDRKEADDVSGKVLLQGKWAGAFDTVGGNTLVTALKACFPGGNVVSCGNVLSPKLSITVFPFILKGVNLLGVDSATFPLTRREKLWHMLANDWKPENTGKLTKVITLEQLKEQVELILAGQLTGRVVIEL